MRQKSLFFFLSLYGMLALSTCSRAYADFVCSSEVSYSWMRAGAAASDTEGSTANGAADPAKKGKDSAENAASSGDTGAPGATVVRLGSIERDGPDEAAAKAKLEVEIGRLKIRASESCRRDHESFGTCVTTKFSANAALLNSLGFSARKEVEKALTDECRSQQGTCTGVEVTAPQCKERVAATPAPAAGGDKKADGKKK